jgi:transposase InsO family protein
VIGPASPGAHRSVVSPASPAATDAGQAGSGRARTSSYARDSVADQQAVEDAAIHGDAHPGAGPAQSPRLPRRAAPCPALRMAGRRRLAPRRFEAALAASPAWGTALTAIAGHGCAASAGNSCTWRSMMRRAWPTSRSSRPTPVTWFRRCGIRVRRLLTDHAFAYRGHALARVCRRWAVRHRFTRPYRPQTNGKAERLIETLLQEWAYRIAYPSSARRTAALRPFLRFYNHRRPHTSLGRCSPWTRFQEAAS